jgi:hypothetical protein
MAANEYTVLTIFFGGMLAFVSIAYIIMGIVDVGVAVRDLFRGPQNQETNTSMFLQYLYRRPGREESLGSIHEGKLMPTIPRCVVCNSAFTVNCHTDVFKSNCIYPRILNTGCASKDYQCFCRNLHDALDDENADDSYLEDSKEPHNWELADRESAKTCVDNCYIVDRVGVYCLF